MKKKFVIAIDGPVGVGKGALAVALARRLGATYIYTGSMYRALTLACLRNNVDIYDEKKVLDLLSKIDIELQVTELETRTFLNKEEISDEIFSPEVSRSVSIVASHANIRKEMVGRQQKMMADKDIVIEGRDTTTVVARDADFKIYLTADIDVRAKRRFMQLEKRGINTTVENVIQEIKERDKRDSERKASPLMIAKDAYILDTTSFTIEETVNKVLEKLKEKDLL